jgi:hypothetical protein
MVTVMIFDTHSHAWRATYEFKVCLPIVILQLCVSLELFVVRNSKTAEGDVYASVGIKSRISLETNVHCKFYIERNYDLI